MTLPKKRIRPRTKQVERRIWMRHRRWVRSHGCCVPFCPEARIEFAHVRTGTDGGTGLKPSDRWGISLCWWHHRQQHEIGEEAFEKFYQIDMKKLAAEFTARTSDRAMRESLKEFA